MFNPKPINDPNYRIPGQCIWLKLNGSWPYDNHEANKDFYSSRYIWGWLYTAWSWYVVWSVGITIGFQTAFLINNLGDIMMTTENCCTTFMGALNFVRLLHMRLNQRQLKVIIQQFVEDIWINKKQHPHVAAVCSRNMRTFRIMTVLLSCLISMYCVLPLVVLFFDVGLDADEKPFPYKMLFPYDAHHGWRYVVTYIFTSYAGICVVTTLFAEDSIFGFFVTYTCGKFQILHERIDNLVLDAYERVRNKEDTMEIQDTYVRLLNRMAYDHNKLIEFAAKLENFFNPILLVNFTISSILICMVGFQLVTGKDMFIGDYVKFFVYMSSSLSQLYVLCWNGDSLIQHSLETANHLYICNWEGGQIRPTSSIIQTLQLSEQLFKRGLQNKELKRIQDTYYIPANKKFRQNLEIMIMCSQRPVKITALKFSTLSLQSFTAILSTSMSYFTLLKTVYDENQEDGATN
ncbi:odorant receptor 13a [Musca vetustissima]|uniref:odorant receptor 13a n=1 Tax=Musca vetustissima TaxID=27455 RepID=UPI002AB708A0|nr:odorant receptor 13a [Musca vetustissima]